MPIVSEICQVCNDVRQSWTGSNYSLIADPGVMEQLDVGIVPYIVLLVVPVLGRMSDQTDSVRFMATQCFATLIRLMPLEVSWSFKYMEYVNCFVSTFLPAQVSGLLHAE